MNSNVLQENHPWIQSYDSGVPAHLEFETLLISDFLKKSAKDFPKNMALQFQGYKMTYKELDGLVNIFASTLKNFGISRGDRVAILLPNTIPCVIAYYAVLRIGAIAVMNCPLYSDRELLH
jgi:long-chain acyl-CoA synthetase